jgi:mRNA-degrading endonuclease toxin of MazEF toxin-antitoxin module
MEPIRTDFKGYEGRTGEIVLADEDPRVVLEQAKGRDHVVVRGRVPYADEPVHVGLA